MQMVTEEQKFLQQEETVDMELDMVSIWRDPFTQRASPELVQTLKVGTQDRAHRQLIHKPATFPGPYTVLDYSTEIIYSSPNSSQHLCSKYQQTSRLW